MTVEDLKTALSSLGSGGAASLVTDLDSKIAVLEERLAKSMEREADLTARLRQAGEELAAARSELAAMSEHPAVKAAARKKLEQQAAAIAEKLKQMNKE